MNKRREQVIWGRFNLRNDFLGSDRFVFAICFLVYRNPDIFAPALSDPILFLLFVEFFLLGDRTTSVCQFPGPTNKLASYSATSLSDVLRHVFRTLRRCSPSGHFRSHTNYFQSGFHCRFLNLT